MSKYLLEVKKICKSFNGITALKDVDISVAKGEILGILGKNGAGKSTLIKVISGVLQGESGEIFIDGELVNIRNPMEAKKYGISIIYEDLNLFERLSVAENIYFGNYPTKLSNFLNSLGVLSWSQIYTKAKKLCEKYGYDINVKGKVRDLSMGEKQIIAILKALSQNARILIMDEPSSALQENDVSKLFSIMRNIKEDGIAIIYITHAVDDIYRIADRVTVISDGEIVKTEEVRNTNAKDLIKSMAGKDMKDRYPKLYTYKSSEVMRAENVNVGNILKDISFSLYKGEVLGLTGLVGSGRSTIARALFGVDKINSGNIYIKGEKVRIKSPIDAVKHRISFIPEDRKKHGIIPLESILKNMTIANLSSVEYEKLRFIIDKSYEKRRVESYSDRLAIKKNSINQNAELLSGGNQQKVLIGRWLFTDTDIIILDEPTKGIDIAGKVEIYNIINELSREGKGVLFISSDLSEILGMSDRILIIRNGRIVKQLMRKEATKELIMYYAYGGE